MIGETDMAPSLALKAHIIKDGSPTFNHPPPHIHYYMQALCIIYTVLPLTFCLDVTSDVLIYQHVNSNASLCIRPTGYGAHGDRHVAWHS